ncbi:integral membrane protein [Colletotrichum chrysophilum]|uniref:Integral membrane protein n=1 Tax=Colletotrichum chrysophilum TaxID=1836956 RepID=A0AAD9AJ42_9PEZI|nr:integral membrane protein [Colletotrichum chrysophilum]
MGHLKSILTMSTSILQRDEALPPDEDIGPASVATAAVLTALMIITTSARIWVRAANRKLGWDDWTILIASGVSIVRFAFVVKQQQYGNGRHRVYLSDYDYMMINMYGWWGQILLFLAVAFLKVSICLLILRIKDTKVLKILLYTIMGGVLVSNFGVVIILVAECQPAGFWRGKSAKCWPTQIRIYSIWATIAFSVLTDLICSLLPLAVVWNVNMPRRTKVSVCFLMGLGLAATGFGIARAASLGITTTDLSWAYCIAGIWSNLELFLGIIAANLALSRSIWVHFFGSNDSHAIPGSTGRSNPTESGYVNSKLRGDQFEVPSTMVRSRRRGSETRSSNSDIPLQPGIQKKTEFWWTEDDESQSQTPLKR